MTLHRLFGVTLVVVSVGVAPAFAQEGPKGGGGAGGGGGNAGGGGGSVNGVSGGGNSPGAPSGGGGGGGSSFGGGGGGGGSMSMGGGGSDFSSFRGSRNSNGATNRGEYRAAEPSYARSVAPGSRSAGSTSNAVNSGGRPRGDRPSLGIAIERDTPADRPSRGGGGIGRLDPFEFGYFGNYGLAYNNCGYGYSYNLYSRCNDPFYSGYGYYGLGSMFYDPYWGYASGGGMQGPPINVSEGLGALRLKVKPNKGQVFIDGYFVGTVDEFDGVNQKIKLEQGHHRVEVRLLGYEPLVFEIDIRRGNTTLFEGQLRPRQ